MAIVALGDDDVRLREKCAVLTRGELGKKAQQAEIDELLDYVYGRRNKSVPRTVRNRGVPGTVGLSANQVGIMKQFCIVDLSIGRRGYVDLHVLVNPRVVSSSKVEIEKVEGCVNFPTIWGKTRRAAWVRVEAWDRLGHEIQLKLHGWAAVLIQHEVDHLNGRLFLDRLIDPRRADLVQASEFAVYRKSRAEWKNKVDVTSRIAH